MTKTIIRCAIVLGGFVAAGVYGYVQEKRQAKKQAKKAEEPKPTTMPTMKTAKQQVKEAAEKVFDAPYHAWKKLSPELRSLIVKGYKCVCFYTIGVWRQSFKTKDYRNRLLISTLDNIRLQEDSKKALKDSTGNLNKILDGITSHAGINKESLIDKAMDLTAVKLSNDGRGNAVKTFNSELADVFVDKVNTMIDSLKTKGGNNETISVANS